jgi:cyclophilin family peptidyl-prolyl cis-trans isomerase
MKSLIFGLFLVLLTAATGCSSPGPPSETAAPKKAQEVASPQPEDSPDDVAVMETYAGRIIIGFFPEEAPKTVSNFKNLARTGFFNRTTFHRVVPGTVIQGGDPLSRDNNPWNDGGGNSGWFIPVEISQQRKHVPGTVSAVRVTGTDTSSCQFFIVLKRIPQWDGQFTIFGEVLEGLELANKISRVSTHKEDPRYRELPVDKQLVKSIRIVRKAELPL